jgi:leucyl-tRNA synthetase
VAGAHRFLHRVWSLTQTILPDIQKVPAYEGIGTDFSPGLWEFRHKVHQTIKKVTGDIEGDFHFNTAIAAVMELANAFYQTLEALPREELTFRVWREALEALVKLINPMVPHIAEELWQILGNDTSLQLQTWPAAQPEALMEFAFTLVVQVDGKLRGKIVVPVSATDEELKNFALNDPSVKEKWLKGGHRRVILAKNRKLVNIVT